MITTEGATYLLNVGVKGVSAYATFYVAPFKGNYTPLATDTAATFPGNAQETTAYDGTTRVAVTFGTVTAGSVDNSASKAMLTASAAETWYGAALYSNPTKGATSGVLLAVQRFPAPRAMTIGSSIELTVDLDLLQPA